MRLSLQQPTLRVPRQGALQSAPIVIACNALQIIAVATGKYAQFGIKVRFFIASVGKQTFTRALRAKLNVGVPKR